MWSVVRIPFTKGKSMRTILCATLMLIGVSSTWADEEKVPLNKLPKAVVESVKKRFPKGEMTAAVKETEEKKTTYEVTLKEGSNKIDVNVNEDGTITGMEKQIALKDLPKVVSDAVAAKYPKAKMKKAEEVIKVKDGKEKLEYYEVTVAEDDKEIEVEISPEGKPKAMENK
jgi:hypothetical protein